MGRFKLRQPPLSSKPIDLQDLNRVKRRNFNDKVKLDKDLKEIRKLFMGIWGQKYFT